MINNASEHKGGEINGVVNVIKPVSFTSHDVVAILRKVYGTKKIGHTGTLDPDATGVLPICIGKATKISDFLMNDRKEYICGVTLGIRTDTGDNSGSILETHERSACVSADDLEKAVMGMKGEIEQTPPMYSAIKINGQKLYDLARKGIEVDLSKKRRRVMIHSITTVRPEELGQVERKYLMMSEEKLSCGHSTDFYLRISCSKGTYVRSICQDIGERLGTVGSMSCLVRTGTGEFLIDGGTDISDLRILDRESAMELVRPVDASLQMGSITVPDELKGKLLNGVRINLLRFVQDVDGLSIGDMLRVYSEDATFIGIASMKDDREATRLTVDKLFA